MSAKILPYKFMKFIKAGDPLEVHAAVVTQDNGDGTVNAIYVSGGTSWAGAPNVAFVALGGVPPTNASYVTVEA